MSLTFTLLYPTFAFHTRTTTFFISTLKKSQPNPQTPSPRRFPLYIFKNLFSGIPLKRKRKLKLSERCVFVGGRIAVGGLCEMSEGTSCGKKRIIFAQVHKCLAWTLAISLHFRSFLPRPCWDAPFNCRLLTWPVISCVGEEDVTASGKFFFNFYTEK